MKLRHELTALAHVRFEDVPWTPSPEPKVERKMLERDGEEVARASSIVRYAPQSSFAPHVHERGEEFIVLEGIFSDEHGDYSAGTYVRNPPGSKHRPFSHEGCVIFVKLRQFDLGDTRRTVVRVEAGPRRTTDLHQFGSERVSLVRLSAGAKLELDPNVRGLEIFVLSGALTAEAQRCSAWSWLRAPRSSRGIEADSECVFWLKQGHLP